MANYEKSPPTRCALYSEKEQGEDTRSNGAGTSKESNIPRLYREGHDRINLEKVRRDQRRARHEFVLAVIRSIKKFLFG